MFTLGEKCTEPGPGEGGSAQSRGGSPEEVRLSDKQESAREWRGKRQRAHS